MKNIYMRLTEEEYYDFLDAHQSLILYAAKKKKLIDSRLSLEQFRARMTGEQANDCANAFYENPHLLRDFIKENPDKLSADVLAIAEDFRYFEEGTFFVYKYLKDYTIFVKDNYAYGVMALSDTFQSLLGNNLPTYIQTVLLPFRNKIVYHGIFLGSRINFGSGYKRGLNEVYKKAKSKYGIITSLPFDGNTVYQEQSPSQKLEYFMKTKANREEFAESIEQLLSRNPSLLPQYYQEWGRIDAKYYRKQFKNLGLNKAHYALLQGQIIASAMSPKELEENIKQLVPFSRQSWVYTFKM